MEKTENRGKGKIILNPPPPQKKKKKKKKKKKIKSYLFMPQKSRGKGNEKHTLKEATTAQPQNAEVRRKSQKQGGEEEAQSND